MKYQPNSPVSVEIIFLIIDKISLNFEVRRALLAARV
jgi:hypothetical protein